MGLLSIVLCIFIQFLYHYSFILHFWPKNTCIAASAELKSSNVSSRHLFFAPLSPSFLKEKRSYSKRKRRGKQEERGGEEDRKKRKNEKTKKKKKRKKEKKKKKTRYFPPFFLSFLSFPFLSFPFLSFPFLSFLFFCFSFPLIFPNRQIICGSFLKFPFYFPSPTTLPRPPKGV